VNTLLSCLFILAIVADGEPPAVQLEARPAIRLEPEVEHHNKRELVACKATRRFLVVDRHLKEKRLDVREFVVNDDLTVTALPRSQEAHDYAIHFDLHDARKQDESLFHHHVELSASASIMIDGEKGPTLRLVSFDKNNRAIRREAAVKWAKKLNDVDSVRVVSHKGRPNVLVADIGWGIRFYDEDLQLGTEVKFLDLGHEDIDQEFKPWLLVTSNKDDGRMLAADDRALRGRTASLAEPLPKPMEFGGKKDHLAQRMEDWLVDASCCCYRGDLLLVNFLHNNRFKPPEPNTVRLYATTTGKSWNVSGKWDYVRCVLLVDGIGIVVENSGQLYVFRTANA